MAPQLPHRPRLYLVAPPAELIGPDYLSQLEAALAGGDVAALLLPAPKDGAFATELAETLVRVAQRQNVAALIENDSAIAKMLHADGVHLTTGGGAVRSMRVALGEGAIVGAYCGMSRHDAMLAGESGADYVAFGAAPVGNAHSDEGQADPLESIMEAAAWWSEIMEPPVVVWLDGTPASEAPSTRDMVTRVVESGAEFFAVGDMVWRSAEGPKAEVAALNALCEGKAEGKTGNGHA